jgi:DNA-binding NtrC family response regulator
VQEADQAEAASDPLTVGTTVKDMERQLIQRTLDGTGGNRTKAAKLLGISLRTLRNKLNEFGLQDRPAKFAQSRAQI